MGCKHRELIVVQMEDGKEKYYCKVFDRDISNFECRDCMMKIEDNNINDLFNQIFGKGFGK